MYSSSYSPSPARASSSQRESTNYQSQSYHRQYYQPSDRINTTTMNNNRNSLGYPSVGYSNSTSSLAAGSPSRKYPRDFATSYNEPTRYAHQNDYQNSRPSSAHYGSTENTRAYSYDDVRYEQARPHSATYQTRPENPYRQQYSPPRRELHADFDDDVVVKSTDLSAHNEQEIVELVRVAFRKYEIANQRELAGFLKRAIDKRFSSCWHCIVGRQFSSYVTHEMNGFIYLTKGPLSILLFRSGI